MRRFLLIAILFSYTIASDAQTIANDFGARSKGIGNSNTAQADEWSLINNLGGTSGVKDGICFFSYDHYSSGVGFDYGCAGAIQPIQIGNIGLSFLKFGDNIFSESTISLAYGNKIDFTRLGVKANYYQMRINEFGTAGAFYFDIGGIVELIPQVTFGAFISNFSLSKLNNPEASELPVLMKIGISYEPVSNLIINVDLHKNVIYDAILKAGIEYLIAEKLYLRTGINSSHFKDFFWCWHYA